MSDSTIYRNALGLNTLLQEYRLESILGAGGFGMTYLARDTHLDKAVAIKEYLPSELAVRALDGSIVPVTTNHEYDYKWGLDRFLQEARTLARFSHPNIVRVYRYFEANGTGYMVMDYEQGESLSALLKRDAAPGETRVRELLGPLLDGLQAVHDAGFLHRDIKPANIYVRGNGTPVLLDFGAARQAVGGATRSITAVLTPGYAPLEQYASDGRQGPWSDIYAMSGVVYRVIAGANPPDAVSRLQNDTVPPQIAAARGRYSEAFLRAVEWGLAKEAASRPQTVQDWRRALDGAARSPVVNAVPVAARAAAPAVPVKGAETTQPNPRLPRAGPRSQANWATRWAVIVCALIAVAVGGSAWNRHRKAGEAAAEAARLDAERSRVAQLEADRAAAEARAAELDAAKRRAEAALEAEQRESARRALELPPQPAVVRIEPVPPGAMAVPQPGQPHRPPAVPQPVPPSAHPFGDPVMARALEEFRTADRDANGFLTREEAMRFPAVIREFDRIDGDRDGRLNPDEFSRFREEQARRIPERRFR